MNVRVLAALFLLVFLLGTIPALPMQMTGAANAGLSAGFMTPIADFYHIVALVGIGLLASWMGEEAMLLIPLCAVLMMAIGCMIQIDDHTFHAVHGFIAGAILLFALSVSMLRNKMHLLSVPPVAVWVYFTGNHYMNDIPSITTPLYCLLGIMISSTLLIMIGISLGVTLADTIHHSMGKLKTMPAISSFLSLF